MWARHGRPRPKTCFSFLCVALSQEKKKEMQRTTTRTASLLVRVTTSLHGTSCHFTSWCELEFWKHRQRIASSIELRKHRRRLRLPGEAPAGSFSKWSNAEGRSGPMVRARHACLLYIHVAFPSDSSPSKKQTKKQGQHHPPIPILTQAANSAPRGRRGRRGGRRGRWDVAVCRDLVHGRWRHRFT